MYRLGERGHEMRIRPSLGDRQTTIRKNLSDSGAHYNIVASDPGGRCVLGLRHNTLWKALCLLDALSQGSSGTDHQYLTVYSSSKKEGVSSGQEACQDSEGSPSKPEGDSKRGNATERARETSQGR
jgi:hypothetical protein